MIKTKSNPTFNKIFQVHFSNDKKSCQNVPEGVAQILRSVKRSLKKHLYFIDRSHFKKIIAMLPNVKYFNILCSINILFSKQNQWPKLTWHCTFHSIRIRSHYLKNYQQHSFMTSFLALAVHTIGNEAGFPPIFEKDISNLQFFLPLSLSHLVHKCILNVFTAAWEVLILSVNSFTQLNIIALFFNGTVNMKMMSIFFSAGGPNVGWGRGDRGVITRPYTIFPFPLPFAQMMLRCAMSTIKNGNEGSVKTQASNYHKVAALQLLPKCQGWQGADCFYPLVWIMLICCW